MIKGSKAKLFLWILSLMLRPVAYCILLLIVPGTFSVASIRENLAGLMTFWAGSFVLIWVVYWLSKFVVRYGPFM